MQRLSSGAHPTLSTMPVHRRTLRLQSTSFGSALATVLCRWVRRMSRRCASCPRWLPTLSCLPCTWLLCALYLLCIFKSCEDSVVLVSPYQASTHPMPPLSPHMHMHMHMHSHPGIHYVGHRARGDHARVSHQVWRTRSTQHGPVQRGACAFSLLCFSYCTSVPYMARIILLMLLVHSSSMISCRMWPCHFPHTATFIPFIGLPSLKALFLIRRAPSFTPFSTGGRRTATCLRAFRRVCQALATHRLRSFSISLAAH